MNIFEIEKETETLEISFEFVIRLGLIKLDPIPCFKYGVLIMLEVGKKRHCIDKQWRCGRKSFRNSKSIFKNTIFDGIHITSGILM